MQCRNILIRNFIHNVKIQFLLSNIKCIHLKYRTKGSTDIILHLRNESYHIMESLGTSGNGSLHPMYLSYLHLPSSKSSSVFGCGNTNYSIYECRRWDVRWYKLALVRASSIIRNNVPTKIDNNNFFDGIKCFAVGGSYSIT